MRVCAFNGVAYLVMLSLTVILMPALSSAQFRYSLTEIGSPGVTGTDPLGMNDSGQVVGRFLVPSGEIPPGFLWEKDSVTLLADSLAEWLYPVAINDTGQVVGILAIEPAEDRRAFIWQSGVTTDLTPGVHLSGAQDINDDGTIVGHIRPDGGEDHPVRWVNGVAEVLPGENLRRAVCVNGAGQIAGYTNAATGFFWDQGTVTEFGFYPTDMNDSGVIIGWGPGNVPRLWRDGVVRAIGPSPQSPSQALYAINNRGEIVGHFNSHAALFRDSTVIDLNAVADTTGGWVLQAAVDINNRGQIIGWGTLRGGGERRAFLLTPTTRWPVFLIPGVGATYPVNVHNVAPWMFTRGIHPTGLQIDPLAHAYDDLIQTLKNVGYVEGKDLFIVNYDWRVVPGPTDGVFDGVVHGITAASITDQSFQYAVDYLGYYLLKAMDAWEAEHPGTTLDSVNFIAHSTGGLVGRTYIQGPAYGGSFAGTRKLPKVDNFIMIGVPNRGASKAWNPLHDNWGVDITFQLVLSKIINLGYQKVLAGAIITGPDIDISTNSIAAPICQSSQQVCFAYQFNPTARALLATYDFIDFGSGFTNVNSDTSIRNNLLLDLNAGLDLALNGDPNAIADSAHVTVIYATNVATPTAAVQKMGPSGREDAVVQFTDFAKRDALPGEVWYEDIVAPSSGDGTVPVESSSGQFIGDARVNLQPFAQGTNSLEDVSHLGLMYNSDVQTTVLNILGAGFLPADISTTRHSKFASQMSTAANVLANIIGGNLLGAVFDPVEGFVVDGDGKRLGFSVATGPVTEIPGSFWFGDSNGVGWVFEPLQQPASLQLSGLGGNYYAMVSVLGETGDGGLVDQGVLAAGAPLVLPIPSTPTGVDDQGTRLNPTEYRLAQNYPNPFNPVTTISFDLPEQSFVTLKVYNVLGQEVATLVSGVRDAGRHNAQMDASRQPGGVYIYRLEGSSTVDANHRFRQAKAMLLIK